MKQKDNVVRFRAERGFIARLDRFARIRKIRRSEVVRQALVEMFDREEKG